MGVSASVSITNQLRDLTGLILGGVSEGETKAAERLLALSSVQAPMDDVGTLVASGQVIPAGDDTDGAHVVYDTPYAARWHEDQPLVDSLGRRYSGGSNFQNGRKSKYVVDPALEHKDELGAIVAKEIRDATS